MYKRTPTLSKTKFLYGLQCHRLLYWRTHEPKAPELAVSPATELQFEHGHLVGKLARERFAGGVLLEFSPWQYRERVDATQAALGADASAIFEASFLEDGVFVAVDVLEREGRSYHLIEVKSTTKQKPQHLPDAAIQLYVLRRAGVDVTKVELMHLNRDCHFPDLSNLFVREDITEEVEQYQALLPEQIADLREALSGDLPDVEIGEHCDNPYSCPFKSRCWPELPRDHVSTLYRIGERAAALVADGIEQIHDMPSEYPLPAVAARQVRSVKSRELIVEAGLVQALEGIRFPIAFLDFEAVAPPVPVWNGCAPYDTIAVQMSCHVLEASGSLTHHDYLAQGAADPRPVVAEALVRACQGAQTILAYNAPFEQGCIERMAEAVPAHREALLAMNKQVVDLLPIIRDHVYHPDFDGSFSLKSVLPALVPILSYSDLEIGEGSAAQAALERLLLDEASLSLEERKGISEQLLAYCKLDTLAMVKLFEVLRSLA